jgi:hypothetical protein
MTRDRALAYSNLMWVLNTAALGELRAAEIERIREAADALVFAKSLYGAPAQLALLDVEDLADALVDDERWPDATASLLVECIADCGPRIAAPTRTSPPLLNRPLTRTPGRVR